MTCGCSTSEERTGCSSPTRPRCPTPCSMPCSPTSSRSAVCGRHPSGGGGAAPALEALADPPPAAELGGAAATLLRLPRTRRAAGRDGCLGFGAVVESVLWL